MPKMSQKQAKAKRDAHKITMFCKDLSHVSLLFVKISLADNDLPVYFIMNHVF